MTLHDPTLHYTPLHHTTLHYPTLQYTTLITPPQMQLRLHYTNYTTPQLQLHYTTTTTTAALQLQLHYTTLPPAVEGEVTKKHNSNHLSVHQWIRSAIHDSQQPTSPIGFQFLKLPPPHCAVLCTGIIYIMSTPD